MNSVVRVATRYLEAKGLVLAEIIYTGVFITPMDQRRLIRRFGQTHPTLHVHHMTLWHRDEGGDPLLDPDLLGRLVDLKVIGYAEDDKAQAVVVHPPTRLRPHDRVPHITLSTASGVNPAYSNTLLAQRWDDEEARRGFPTVRGRVGWFDGSQVRFDTGYAA